VVFVGLMGSGKTTIGARVAQHFGRPLRDSDVEIEAREGRTVRQLRDEIGVDGMHELEAWQLLDALADPAPSVICPAASIAEVDACLRALEDPSVAVVFLTADPAEAAARFIHEEHRPWYGDDPAEFLARQARSRYPRFRALGPIEVATDGRTPDQVVGIVVEALAVIGLAIQEREE
jgi:shikimate kinase